jgi:glycosyltransferase involved in cell wall biosynthesis
MAHEPGVSVVVPVRDGERYIEEALRSVAGQTYQPLEVIVVDDGSRDRSVELARGLGARVERQPAKGQAAARNRGVRLSRGKLLSFLDADDLWPPDKIERQVGAVDAHPEVDLVFGHLRQFISPELTPSAAAKLRCPDKPQPALHFGSLLARRAALERVGPFSEEWRVGELMEWLLRARERGLRELMLPDVVLYRRLHEFNTSRRERASRRDHALILKRALDRRRAGTGG